MTVDDAIFADLLARAEAAEENAVDVIQKEVQPVMEFLKERIGANAPYQTGNLASKISVSVEPTETGVEATFTANTNYALMVHERPPVEGREDPDGSEPEGGRGRKYISRVMDYHAQTILGAYQRAQARLIGKG